jgi:iron complex outermembrane recepter protein
MAALRLRLLNASHARSLLLFVLVARLQAPDAFGAAHTGRIAGSVEDPTGGRIASAAVSLAGPVARTATTDAEGRFAFGDLPDGEYRLRVAPHGFAPTEQRVRISNGSTVSVAFRLVVRIAEKIVVTATKTGEHELQSTPLAVSVLSAEELRRSESQTIADLAGQSPSLTFSQAVGYGQLTIRGIGTNAVLTGADPSSAVYVDGVYLARPAMVLADFVDLDRVEVLRGPQGTLYGRNAVGGALNILTKLPSDTFEATARIAAGNLGARRAEASVSGPIVAGRLRGSAALLRGVEDGFVRDLEHPGHPLGGVDVLAARGKLQYVWSPRVDLLLSGDVTHQDPMPLTYAKVLAVKPGFVVENPQDLHEVRTSVLQESRNLQYGTAARLAVQLSPQVLLTSLTAFRKIDYDLLVEGDITELELLAAHTHEAQHQWSEELMLAGSHPGRAWVGGVFLFGDQDRQPSTTWLGGPRLVNSLDPKVRSRSHAVFAQATFGLMHGVSATAGFRYTREEKMIDNAGRLDTQDVPPLLVPGSSYTYFDAIAHDAWTPKLGLEWRVRERMFAYVSATRGFKSGGFNITSREAGRGYAPEWAWSCEAGLKTSLLGRGTLDLAAFHTDYTDLQVQTVIRPGVLDISNAAEATISGVELEASGAIVPGLRLGGHLAWLDATYDRYVAVGVGGVTGDVAGHRLSNAPEWSGRLWLEWSRSAGRLGTLSLRAASRWQSTVFFTPFNDAVQRQSPYGLLELSAELGPRYVTVSAYARNLTDEGYITGSSDSPPPAIGGRPAAPREWGVRLAVRLATKQP